MSLHSVPRRIVGFAIAAALILGQPGSVCAVHCLFAHHHMPGDHVAAAAGSQTAADAPGGHESFCRPDESRLQSTAVGVMPLGPMAVGGPMALDVAPAAWLSARASTPAVPADVSLVPNRPPPRA